MMQFVGKGYFCLLHCRINQGINLWRAIDTILNAEKPTPLRIPL
jgi:hypothetical protein